MFKEFLAAVLPSSWTAAVTPAPAAPPAAPKMATLPELEDMFRDHLSIVEIVKDTFLPSESRLATKAGAFVDLGDRIGIRIKADPEDPRRVIGIPPTPIENLQHELINRFNVAVESLSWGESTENEHLLTVPKDDFTKGIKRNADVSEFLKKHIDKRLREETGFYQQFGGFLEVYVKGDDTYLRWGKGASRDHLAKLSKGSDQPFFKDDITANRDFSRYDDISYRVKTETLLKGLGLEINKDLHSVAVKDRRAAAASTPDYPA